MQCTAFTTAVRRQSATMSKSTDSSPKLFHLETDDRSEEERAKSKHMKKSPCKDKMPMDSNYLEDVVEASPKIKFNLHFDKWVSL